MNAWQTSPSRVREFAEKWNRYAAEHTLAILRQYQRTLAAQDLDKPQPRSSRPNNPAPKLVQRPPHLRPGPRSLRVTCLLDYDIFRRHRHDVRRVELECSLVGRTFLRTANVIMVNRRVRA